MEQSVKKRDAYREMFFDDKTPEHVKCASNVSFMFILLDISVQRRWREIKRGLISGTKFLPSMSRRLNILFWCQSLRIIEQSAASQALHFAQTFNCHTRRERPTYKRRNTQQSIRRQDPRGTWAQYIWQNSRVLSVKQSEESLISHCRCHRCSDDLNLNHKVKYVSPPRVCGR